MNLHMGQHDIEMFSAVFENGHSLHDRKVIGLSWGVMAA